MLSRNDFTISARLPSSASVVDIVIDQTTEPSAK